MKIDYYWKEMDYGKHIINKNPSFPNILVIDFGIKNSQLRALLQHDIQLTVTDPNHDIPEILNKEYDGIFLSNGPGDPRASKYIVNQLKSVLKLGIDIPILGICYGHQV